jgi:uncharacterized protein
MERCAKLGHKGVLLPAGLPDDMSYADPEFEPLWDAVEKIGMPIHFHINVVQGSDRMATRLGQITMRDVGNRAVRRTILEALTLVKDLVFGMVLDKHPRMRVVFAEYDLAWILPFMTKMDGSVRRAQSENTHIPKMSALPSETIKRQVYITFQEDPAGLAGALATGLVDNCMWASDYPHGGSTWPKSKEVIQSQISGLSEAVAKKLTWGNAARLYGVA